VCLSRNVAAIVGDDRGVTLDARLGRIHANATNWTQPSAETASHDAGYVDGAIASGTRAANEVILGRRTRNHGDDPTDFSPYARVRRGDERTNRSSSRRGDAQARHRARNLNVVLLHDHWITDVDGVEVPFRVLGAEADAAVAHVLESE
jgi:hypothetical protein